MATEIVGSAGFAAGVFQQTVEAAVVADGAAGAGVEGYVVCGLVVGAFEDVDFAAVGPVGSDHPESGPGGEGDVC